MRSIRKKLVRTISISISSILLVILIITDISVDTWIENEFNRALLNKAHLLITLVKEDGNGVDFDFAGEFMPEFERKEKAEFFQLWRKGSNFERSDTLDIFNSEDLPMPKLGVNETQIGDIELPDGRAGRIVHVGFMPQVDSTNREEYFDELNRLNLQQEPMYIALAMSSENLNWVLWLVDIVFIVTAILATLLVRGVVSKTVKNGLLPLQELNQKIKDVNIAHRELPIYLSEPTLELEPIVNELNSFINENRELYLREQRVTSDIAHELRTPISELINLCEVAIKFPDDKEIKTSFKSDILEISNRLGKIVSNILVLQKSNYTKKLVKELLELEFSMNLILNRFDNLNVQLNFDKSITHISVNKFAFESIITNLLSNAEYYSPQGSTININICKNDHGNVEVQVKNQTKEKIRSEDLKYFFEPLWQQDNSRTSTQRFGLGLSIVKSLAEAMEARISVQLSKEYEIVFSLEL